MPKKHLFLNVVEQSEFGLLPSALFQLVSMESREYEDMKSILTSSYIDQNSAGCFTYSRPRLVHSELLEKEVRREQGWRF